MGLVGGNGLGQTVPEMGLEVAPSGNGIAVDLPVRGQEPEPAPTILPALQGGGQVRQQWRAACCMRAMSRRTHRVGTGETGGAQLCTMAALCTQAGVWMGYRACQTDRYWSWRRVRWGKWAARHNVQEQSR